MTFLRVIQIAYQLCTEAGWQLPPIYLTVLQIPRVKEPARKYLLDL